MGSNESDERCRKAVAEALGYDTDHNLLPALEQLLKEVKTLRAAPGGPMGLSVQCSRCNERVWRYEIVDRVKNECYRCRILDLEQKIEEYKVDRVKNECYRCRILDLEQKIEEYKSEHTGLDVLLEQILQDEGKTAKVQGYGLAVTQALDVVIALRDGHKVATEVTVELLKSEAQKAHTTATLIAWDTGEVEEDDDD